MTHSIAPAPVTLENEDRSRRPFVRISTATLPGLIQAYALATERLPQFGAQPEKLKTALESSETKDLAIFMLQRGSQLLTCLEALEAGDLDDLRRILMQLITSVYRSAEKGGVS